ncbi:MAG: glycosyltransferase [Candidatus Omnitrophica bacterium]|nr:glycosyltransferase [Candidatus Omnitrophota bacterium]
MKRLAVIPSDPIEEYIELGFSMEWLTSYYNPCKFFDEVYLLSPLEKDQPLLAGMKVFHTPVKDLKKRIKDLKIDVLRAYGGNWACRAACENKVEGVPVVVSVHDRRPERLYNAVKNADIVLCVSQVVKELVTKKFKKPDHIWILPNRVNFEIMRPIPAAQQDKPDQQFSYKYKILFVGRLSEEKNLDTLIKALKFLGNDYGVLVIGRGEKRVYQDIALKESVEKQCFFIESVRNEDLPQYYSWCDCMCMPSRNEGFPKAFLEAMASEAVFVTSNIAPMNEFITDLDNGLLINEYENPQALADVIKRACTDNALRMNLKKNSRRSVERFEKGKIDKLEVEYYQKILTMKDQGGFKVPFWKKAYLVIKTI